MKCARCLVAGHGAADRSCPKFTEAAKNAKARRATSGYKYFVTEDPDTWERLDDPVTEEVVADPYSHRSNRTTRGGSSARVRDDGWMTVQHKLATKASYNRLKTRDGLTQTLIPFQQQGMSSWAEDEQPWGAPLEDGEVDARHEDGTGPAASQQ
ncbi:hypothetical protein L218DRAFT_746601 [Marasmius fiardii PR-910]|nr:hypothetical protein L218DRAFT_746601 [Marasmius fiardii PR-910]